VGVLAGSTSDSDKVLPSNNLNRVGLSRGRTQTTLQHRADLAKSPYSLLIRWVLFGVPTEELALNY
jgi:hypothetical protein